ncbi:M14 family metallopeptidase [soil metagenome]
MTPTTTLFSSDYASARRRFLAACTLAGLDVAEHRHALAGASGETLATDVVRIGPADAARLLVLTSGVHGVELFAGSGCQIDWLLHASATQLPPDTAVLVVHAINPWGASWLRRYTEDNVDLCRNYVDYARMPQLPSTPDYAPLHPAVIADPRDAVAIAAADRALSDFEQAKGHQALYGALMGGQYDLPSGMGFGGKEPTWSRQTMEHILRRHGAAARHVCLVDYHTGLGPYGYGSMVALQQGEALARMRQAFGGRVEAVLEHGAPENFAPVYGHSTPGYERALPHATVTAGVLEYGTGRSQRMLELLLRDQREWAASPAPAGLSPTRRDLLDFFYPAQPEWQRSLVDQSRLIIGQALAFLARSS